MVEPAEVMGNSGLKYDKDPKSKGIVEFILQVWLKLKNYLDNFKSSSSGLKLINKICIDRAWQWLKGKCLGSDPKKIGLVPPLI